MQPMLKKVYTRGKITVAVFKQTNAYRIGIFFYDYPNEYVKKIDEEMVYSRSFPDMLAALGYYKVLCALSDESIHQLIINKTEELYKD